MKKVNYLSFISVISCISVVFLHTNGCFWDFSYERYWKISNIIESVFYFSVPTFFMISGAKLINYSDRYDTKVFFKKRIKKVVVPSLIWSFIGIIYYCMTNIISINDLGVIGIINSIINFTYPNIYWYFPCCFSLYLAMPLFTSIRKDKRKKVLIYLTTVYFITMVFIPFIITIFKFKIDFPLKNNLCSYYLFYALIGYLINEYNIFKNKKTRYLLYFFGIIGLLLHIIGTYILSINAGYIISTYKGYDNFPCVLYSIAIFVLCKYLYAGISNTSFVNKFILIGSKYTLSIYLIHIYINDIFINIFGINNYSILYRIGAPFVIIPICMITTFILRKIKFIRDIVPE